MSGLGAELSATAGTAAGAGAAEELVAAAGFISSDDALAGDSCLLQAATKIANKTRRTKLRDLVSFMLRPL